MNSSKAVLRLSARLHPTMEVAALIALGCGVGIASVVPTLAVVIIGLLLGALSLMRVDWALFLLTIFLFIRDGLASTGVMGHNVGLVLEAIMACLVLVAAFRVARSRRSSPIPITVPMLLLLVSACLSAVVNSVNPLIVGSSLRDIMEFAVLYYAIQWIQPGRRTVRNVVLLFLGLTLAQLPILLWQGIQHFRETGSYYLEDLAVGTQGPNGTPKLALLAAFSFLLLTGLYRSYPSRRKAIVVAMAATALIVVLADVRALFFILPLVLVVTSGTSLRHVVRGLLLSALLGGITVLFYSGIYGKSLMELNPVALYNQQLVLLPYQVSRVGFLTYSARLVTSSGHLLVGVGPGTYVSKTGRLMESPLYKRFLTDFPFPNGFSEGTQISPLLVEYGLIGTMSVLVIFAILYAVVRRRPTRMQDPLHQSISFAAQAGILLYILCFPVTKILENQQASYAVWLFAAIEQVMHNSPSAAQQQIEDGANMKGAG